MGAMAVQTIRFFDEFPAGLNAVIFGAGNQGKALCRVLKEQRSDMVISALVDHAVRDADHEPPIRMPEESDLHVIVPHNLRSAAERTLDASNVEKLYVMESGINFAYLFLPCEVKAFQEKLECCCSYLPAQEATLFRQVVAARTFDDAFYSEEHPRFHLKPSAGEGLYIDFIEPESVHTAVMGGVASGGAERRLLASLPNLKQMVGFDPFPELYHAVPDQPLEKEARFTFVPKGLDEITGVRYLHQMGHGSFISEKKWGESDQEVPVVRLDDLDWEHLDLLKLDVEGSEAAALNGAQETIQRLRPALAVCAYHKQYDLFHIPEKLFTMLEDYSFHFAHYTQGFEDSVWYAIPTEKQRTKA